MGKGEDAMPRQQRMLSKAGTYYVNDARKRKKEPVSGRKINSGFLKPC
ncbi:MAG: hypothetical protein PHI32_13635 [Dysgonamonadaceae bacterium]|nr:hypothetical protein [Dysgonamonadaceae bacterium]